MKKIKITILFLLFLLLVLNVKNLALGFSKINKPASDTSNEALKKTNEDILSSIDVPLSFIYNYDYGVVINRDIYDFNDYLKIVVNEPLEDNLVINETGVLGVIKEINGNEANVMLLTNKDSSISVKVNDNYGILKYIDNEFYITNLTTDNISEGALVYTSGLTNILGNVYLGRVDKIVSIDSKIALKVILPTDFNKIYVVGVIK